MKMRGRHPVVRGRWKFRLLQFTGSIRSRVLLLVLLAIAPLLAERIYALHVERQDRIRFAAHQLLDLAKQGANMQEALTISTQAILQTIATTLPNIGDPERSDCRSLFASIKDPLPWVHSFMVALSDGQVVCANRPQLIGADLSQSTFFLDAMVRRAPVTSDFVIGPITGQPIVAIAHPVVRGNPVTDFVVVATIDLSWISKLIEMPAARGDAIVFVVDKDGKLVVRYPNFTPGQSQNFTPPDLFQNTLGVLTTTDIDGERRIFSSVGLGSMGARLIVGVRESEILATINQQIFYTYIVLALVIIAALLATTIGGDRLILRPIQALVRRAAALGRGDYQMTERPFAAPTEFRPLVRALAVVSAKLRERESEMKMTNERLDQLAQFDALTGLRNRRSFDLRLALEESNARVLGTPLSLLMIDVDYFKQFNDLYGHVAGDACLREVAKVIFGILGETDFAARYGGEEFSVLIRETPSHNARLVAEQLRKTVHALAVPHESSPHRSVTVSIGIASLAFTRAESAERLLERADHALYRAKKLGRNCIVFDEDMLSLAS